MEPLAALGVGSNIIQLADFSSRILSKSLQLYRSADGKLEEHLDLESATQNLSKLLNDLIKQPNNFSHDSDKQLEHLKQKTERIGAELQETFGHAAFKGKKLASLHLALRAVWNEEKITKHDQDLRSIREEVNTALLVSLRQKIQEPKAPIPHYEHANQAQRTLFRDIGEKKWLASHADDLTAFTQRLHTCTDADIERRFCDMILQRLDYHTMVDREDSISKAHAQTFEWIFDDRHSEDRSQPWSSFTNWIMQEDSRPYWISGKPGSGKSTLMKFIFGHPKLDELLLRWGSGRAPIKAGFFFWNSGNDMQKSRVGLLRTLLHTCLRNHKELAVKIFDRRWEQYLAFWGGQDLFSWQELCRALKQLLSNQSERFFLLIDGLDEFDGQPRDLIDLVASITQSNVKLCVASRPWLPFEEAFEDSPHMQLEQLTRPDISTYVIKQFQKNKKYMSMKIREPLAAHNLQNSLLDKAQGIFLWVYLVVMSLLEGLTNGDTFPDLQIRLNAIPLELDDLFRSILAPLEPQYFRQACRLFRLMQEFYEMNHTSGSNTIEGMDPKILDLYFADDDNINSSLRAPHSQLQEQDVEHYADTMRRRLNARCRGLLESIMVDSKASHAYVCFIHRTARDWVQSEAFWPTVLEQTHHDAFRSEERRANADLWRLKARYFINDTPRFCVCCWTCCMVSALRLHLKHGDIQRDYLDEYYRVKAVDRHTHLYLVTGMLERHRELKLDEYWVYPPEGAENIIEHNSSPRLAQLNEGSRYGSGNIVDNQEKRKPRSKCGMLISRLFTSKT